MSAFEIILHQLQDEDLEATVMEILRNQNLFELTMKGLILMVEAKYSQFDLRQKRAFIKSFTKAEVSYRSPCLRQRNSFYLLFVPLQLSTGAY